MDTGSILKPHSSSGYMDMKLHSGNNGQEEIQQIPHWAANNIDAQQKNSPVWNAAHFGDVMVHKMAGNSPHQAKGHIEGVLQP